jgi:hypothetical protein
MLIGRHKIIRTNLCLLYGCLLKTIADALLTTITPISLPRAIGLSCLSMAATGWVSVALVVCTQLACKDRNLGLATLLLSSARNFGGSIAVVVYASVLQHRVKEEAITRVVEAVVPLEFVVENILVLIENLGLGEGNEAVMLQQVGLDVWSAAMDAMKWAWAEGFRYLFAAAAGFSGVSLVACWWVGEMGAGR